MPVEALIVSMRRRGPGQMLGLEGTHMGDASNVIDTLTGGEYSRLGGQLDNVEMLLKVAIAASIVAGVAGLFTIFRGR